MAEDLCTASNAFSSEIHHCPRLKSQLAERVVTVAMLLALVIVLKPNYLH